MCLCLRLCVDSEVGALEEVLPRALILDSTGKDWDSEAQRYCILASENMTMDQSKHRFVMRFLNEIVHMLERPPHPSYRASAVGIVRNLGLTPKFRPHLLPTARLMIAVLLEPSQPTETRTKASDYLALISEDDHCKNFLMQRRIFSVIARLVEQCEGGNEQRMMGNVARTLQNFVLIEEAHQYLLEEELLLTIMVLGSMNGVVDCMISIVRVLEILSTYSNKLTDIVNLKGIEIVLQAFFCCDTLDCRDSAMGFIAHLVHHPRFYQRLIGNMTGEAVAAGLEEESHDLNAKACEAIAFLSRNPEYHPRLKPTKVLKRVILDWTHIYTQLHTHTHTRARAQVQISHPDVAFVFV